MPQRWIVIVGWAVALAAASPAEAAGPFTKLGRGVANVATGVLEVPVQIVKTTEIQGSVAGVTAGLAKGVAYGIGRTFVGVVEVLTFLFPNREDPDPYGPILHPEFIVLRDADKL